MMAQPPAEISAVRQLEKLYATLDIGRVCDDMVARLDALGITYRRRGCRWWRSQYISSFAT